MKIRLTSIDECISDFYEQASNKSRIEFKPETFFLNNLEELKKRFDNKIKEYKLQGKLSTAYKDDKTLWLQKH